MSAVVVINSGSSSIKYQIIDEVTEERIARGLIERIGGDIGTITHEAGGTTTSWERYIPTHAEGIRSMLRACQLYGPDLETLDVRAVGHRVAHGGSKFIEPTVLDESVIEGIEEIIPLAPLHNPANVLGIRAAIDAFPDVPHVAIFDTAFHQTIPVSAYTYAIEREVAQRTMLRRYGFHGTSHKYVSQLAAQYLDKPWEETNSIILHIGNGSSACAVQGGKSIDTSMGLTPLEGLVMGTRSGDIDPGAVFHLHRVANMSLDEMENMLNRRSGLLGMCGRSDMRDVIAGADQGIEMFQIALGTFCHRLKHYIGAYYAQLGRVDAIVFTAGIGEHTPQVRSMALSNMHHMGIDVDEDRNSAPGSDLREISTDGSRIKVLVIPTNEELEIARQTMHMVSATM